MERPKILDSFGAEIYEYEITITREERDLIKTYVAWLEGFREGVQETATHYQRLLDSRPR
jgi:hypothetical protein